MEYEITQYKNGLFKKKKTNDGNVIEFKETLQLIFMINKSFCKDVSIEVSNFIDFLGFRTTLVH